MNLNLNEQNFRGLGVRIAGYGCFPGLPRRNEDLHRSSRAVLADARKIPRQYQPSGRRRLD
jgi:hypothetical protein